MVKKHLPAECNKLIQYCDQDVRDLQSQPLLLIQHAEDRNDCSQKAYSSLPFFEWYAYPIFDLIFLVEKTAVFSRQQRPYGVSRERQQ